MDLYEEKLVEKEKKIMRKNDLKLERNQGSEKKNNKQKIFIINDMTYE